VVAISLLNTETTLVKGFSDFYTIKNIFRIDKWLFLWVERLHFEAIVTRNNRVAGKLSQEN